MTIVYLAGNRLTGVASDTKPTDIPANSVFVETDTAKTYIFDGSSTWTEMGGGDISNYVAFKTNSTWGDYEVPTAVTSVSSTKADTWHTVQGTSSSTFTVQGTAWSASTGGKSYATNFTAGHASIGTTFTKVKAYTKTNDNNNFFLYYCKGSGNTGGTSKTISIPSNTSSVVLNESTAFTAVTIEAGDKFQLGASTTGIINTTKGTTSAITGSGLQYQVYDSSNPQGTGTGSYGQCGGALSGGVSNGGFYMEVLKNYSSSNMTTATQGLTWESDNEANANCVLDFGSSKLIGGVAFFDGSDSTFVQILIQTSNDGSTWTTQRTVNATQLTSNATNFIRFNIGKYRYLRVYVNDGGTARILQCRADGYIVDGLENHTHLEISTSSTSIGLDGT